MTPRQKLAAAIRPFGPGGQILPGHIAPFDALADALGLPRDDEPAHRLGSLSERFESGGRGPGTVSSGRADPGGVSYGTYQLASRTGTLRDFLLHEGKPWAAELARGGTPGSSGFSRVWREIADRQPAEFADAQHAYIKRTHYAPAVRGVLKATGVDLDRRSDAVRDAVWSVGVQHGGAVRILTDALREAGGATANDATLLRAVYDRRSDYVRSVADRYTGATRNSLLTVVENRYPAELMAALQMLKG